MKSLKSLSAALALAACTTPVPESGAGVGFGDYSDYVRQREAAQQNAGQPLSAVTPQQPVFSTEAAAAAIDNAQAQAAQPAGRVIGDSTTMQTTGIRPRGGAPIGIKEESGEMGRSAGISDEQDFGAVSARESIESDAERLARQRAQYEVVAPTALPQRSGDTGPNIVNFALATTHAPGTQLYKRGNLFQKDPLITCAKYPSPDLAQEAFLAKGGPEKDREGLDPDGDGFACGWDPRPFRNALR